MKEINAADTDIKYPNEVFLSLHKDESSESFFDLLLEKHYNDKDITPGINLRDATGISRLFTTKHTYKINGEDSLMRLKRLPERSFHVEGIFCMDGRVVSIEPLHEGTAYHQKHFFTSRNSADSSCKYDRNIPQNSFKDEEEKLGPFNFKLSNAFDTYSEKNKLKERVKREIEKLTIELLMVIDYAAYSWWGTMVGKSENSDSQIMSLIRQYYAYVFQGISRRFSSIDKQTFGIDLAFSGLFVAKSEHESYWTTTSTIDGDGDSTRVMVNSSEALEKFQKWLDNADFLPKYDHAILFTGTNLTYAGSPGNTGLAFASSMCRNISNSSIVEDIFDFRTITYATQQVARALGTRDDMDNNDCLEFFNYLMAPKFKLPIKSFASNKWTFSACSEQYINDYFLELKEDGLTCLKETSLIENYPADFLSLVRELPGAAYSGKAQCENAFGLQSDVCRLEIGTSYSKICSGLLCIYPGSDKCGFILPADGTPCGNKKYCWQGSCLEHEDATERSDTCPFGNDASIDCYRRIVNEPSECYSEDIRYKCCKTCELIYTGITGCEYGDRSDDCTLRGCVDGDQDYASKTCCLTCLDGPTPFARPILSTSPEPTLTSSPILQTLPNLELSLSSSSNNPFSFSPSTFLSEKSPTTSPFITSSSFTLDTIKSSYASSSLPLFSSTDMVSTSRTKQPNGITVATKEEDTSMLHIGTEEPLPHSSSETNHNVDLTTPNPDMSSALASKNIDAITMSNVVGNPNALNTDIPSSTETNYRSVTNTLAPFSSSKQGRKYEHTVEETTVSKMFEVKEKDVSAVTKTTPPQLLNATKSSTSGVGCSCPVYRACTTSISPSKHSTTEQTVTRKCPIDKRK